VAFVIISTILFWFAADRSPRETLIFFAAMTAAGGQLCGSFYTARALSAAISANRRASAVERLREERAERLERLEANREKNLKLRTALDYGRRYNDPSMYQVRDVLREIMSSSGSQDQFITMVTERETNVIHILNFLEEIATCLQTGVADDTILRNQFEAIVVQSWRKLSPWIQRHRDIRRSQDLWEDLERLYQTWKIPRS